MFVDPQGSAQPTPAASTQSANANPAPPAKLGHALDVVRRGLRVTPLPPKRKKPRKNIVCSNEADVRHHWEKHPDDDVAISLAGYAVLAINLRKGGLKELVSRGFPFPKTTRWDAPNDRMFAAYNLPPGGYVRGGKGPLDRSVDILLKNWIVVPAFANKQPVALAPQWLIDWCAGASSSSSGSLACGNTADDTVATDARSALGHSANVDDRNRIQRPPNETGEAHAAAAAIDPTIEPGNSAEPASALDDDDPNPSEPADREANPDKTEATNMANPRKIDAESRGDAPTASAGKVLQFPDRPIGTKPAVIGQPYPSKLEAALDHARRGFPVFPLVPNAKVPVVVGWQDVATTDPERIKKCWTEDPTRNIGVPTHDYLVVDVDPRNGGEETMKKLVLEQKREFTTTARSQTQSGGSHAIYKLPPGVRVRGGAHLLGPGVDIKSWGGYIVAPGSTIDDRPYRWGNEHSVAPAPQWLIDLCGAPRARAENAGKRLIPEDEDVVARAREWMERQPAAEYGTIDDTEYKMAAYCYDVGCGVDAVEELLTEWCIKHDIPTSPERLRTIADSAGRNRQNAIGIRSAVGFEAMEIAERPPKRNAPATTTGSVSTENVPEIPPKRVRKATLIEPFEEDSLSPRPWTLTHFAGRGDVTVLPGDPGAFKSTYAFPVALTAITGRNDICGFPAKERTRVWMWNQEEKPKELRRRLLAAMKEHGVSWDDLKDENGKPMLRMDSGVPESQDDNPDPLILAKRNNRALKTDEAEIEAMINEIRSENIGLLILDPLVEFHEGNENDNMEMRIVMTALRTIAARSDCAIVVFAHTAKPPVASSKSFAGHIGAIRGAFSQVGAARVVATVFPAAKDDGKTWILPGGYERYTRIDVCKINNGPKQTIWLEHKFQLVGSERIPTLRHVKIEKTVKEGEANILEAFARVMAETRQLNNVPLKTLIDQVPELTAEDKAELGGHAQKRKRRLDRAFGGDNATEVLTDYGKLIRIAGKAPVGILFALNPLKQKEADDGDSAPEDLSSAPLGAGLTDYPDPLSGEE